jgi:hypothetical protein
LLSRQIAAGNEHQHQVTKARWRQKCSANPLNFGLIARFPVNSRPSTLTQLAVACLGAGVITTFAVAQGQNPITALGITLFSAVAAVALGQVL